MSNKLTKAFTKANIQYLYSTASQQQPTTAADGTVFPMRGKSGETRHQTAAARVAQQNSTGNSEPFILLDHTVAPDNITDSMVRAQLNKMGYYKSRIDADREWVDFVGLSTPQEMVDAWRSAINSLVNGVARPNTFAPRDEQAEAIDKCVTNFVNGDDSFLFNCKMRFGKTTTAYWVGKNYRTAIEADKLRMLVLTYKPAVEDSWKTDLETHVDFVDWDYYYAKDFNNANPVELKGDATHEVLFASFQDLNDFGKAKWANILDYHFDILVIDEQHYGTRTERAQETINKLSFDKMLEMSGTPLHALMSGSYTADEMYNWTYAQEQAKRKAEKDAGWATEIYRWLPVMKFMTFELSNEAKALTSSYETEEGFTMVKAFGSNDGEKFVDEAAVSMWLEEAYGIRGHKNNSPIRQHNSNHMVWRLPSVNACNAMAALLNKTPFVKHNPIVVSGDKGADLQDVKEHIERNDKTVTLTCGSLMTGTTVPEWDMIFMLDGGSSAQDYFQTIFRVQSPNKKAGKEECFVVDYNPQRTLQMIYEFAFVQAQNDPNKTVKGETREFLDFAPVLDHTGNKPVVKNVEDVLASIAATSNAIERFTSAHNVNFNNVTDDIKNMFAKVTDYDKKSSREAEVSDNDIELGKNKEKPAKKGKGAGVDLTVKEMRELQQKAISVISRLPNFLWVEADPNIVTVDDILAITNGESKQDFFDETGVTLGQFKMLMETGFLNRNRVNLCVLCFQQTYIQPLLAA